MLKRIVAVSTLVGALAVSGGVAVAAPSSHSHWMRSCAAPSGATAACNALVVTDGNGKPGGTTQVQGFGPADLQSAYNLQSGTAGTGQTVAIVDAYNDPYAASDLATYRLHFGLSACTTSNGCLTIVNQTGGTRLPTNNGGWAEEESLDLDMVSAICPNCHIVLVEASSSSFTNLGAAVNYAASLHPAAISNSYGGSDAPDSTYGKYYNHPGIAVTASAGDSGYGAEYPASSQYVTAVGGTSLTAAPGTTRGWSETAWSGSGSGCSAYNSQPSWQASVGTGCSKRAEADVSADADPNTGVAVYDSYSYQGYHGWLEFGGTSVASPIIASVYALAGNASTVSGANLPYAHTGSLYDVTTGSNGSCPTSQWCHAGTGWDGPTGLGTPNGVGAF